MRLVNKWTVTAALGVLLPFMVSCGGQEESPKGDTGITVGETNPRSDFLAPGKNGVLWQTTPDPNGEVGKRCVILKYGGRLNTSYTVSLGCDEVAHSAYGTSHVADSDFMYDLEDGVTPVTLGQQFWPDGVERKCILVVDWKKNGSSHAYTTGCEPVFPAALEHR